MYFEVKSKWVSETLKIIVTEDQQVFSVASGRPVKLKPHYHQGQIKYFVGKKRISQRQINNSCVKHEEIIQEYCPF